MTAFYLRLIFLFTLCMGNVCTLTVNGEIKDDRPFYYETFDTPPSKSAPLEYTFTFPGDYVHLHFYTAQDHINIKKKCSFLDYGQVLNYNMHKEFDLESNAC